MKCPHCGAENFRAEGLCVKCGRSLRLAPAHGRLGQPNVSRPSSPQGQISHVRMAADDGIGADDVANKLRLDYLHATRDQNQRVVEALDKLMAHFRKPELDLNELLDDAVKMIYQQFRLRAVTIGLRGHDGLFRYTTQAGFREDAWNARKKLAYALDDFFGDSTYKGTVISEYTKVYLEEDKPYTDSEEVTYNRPVLLKSKRISFDHSLEGDYIDIHIYGVNKELLGWIEISGTLSGKVPDVVTIRWLELISSMLGVALMHRGKRAPPGPAT